MAQFEQPLETPALFLTWVAQDDAPEPSAPAILLHSAGSLVSTGLGVLLAHRLGGYDLLTSVVAGLLTLLLTFGPWGLFCAWLTDSTTLGRNLVLSCGLTVVTLLFLGFCLVLGGLAAVVVQAVGVQPY